jgi:hypothetical protein
MNKLHLEFEIAHNLFKDSIGKQYQIYASSLSGGADFSINSGTIERVELDYEFDILEVHLDGDSVETFGLRNLKEISTVEKEKYTMIKPVYKDGSYFKIYITEIGGE